MRKPKSERQQLAGCSQQSLIPSWWLRKAVLVLVCALAALPLAGREKDAIQWGMGLIVNVPFPESEVAQVVHDVAQNGIIRGTKEYNKDEYVTGAAAVGSTRVFPEKAEGQVFYKVRLKALDPRNFRDSGDVGTLAVRYLLQPQGDKNTVLRIDARFVEDFRKVPHASNGSVESAEYKDIHDRLDAIESMKAATAEAKQEKEEYLARKQGLAPANVPESSSLSANNDSAVQAGDNAGMAAAPLNADRPVVQTLEEHVKDLRRQVERTVKSPGAPLKSAPFNTASTLQTLVAGTQVLIVVSTPYWLGIETHDGQHGWMLRDDLELLP